MFCYDVYRQIRPEASERSTIAVGRVVTFVAMAAAIVWAPRIQDFGSILEGNTMLLCYMAPSVTAVFLGGVLWKGATSRGAVACLASGAVLGATVFLMDWNDRWEPSFMMTCFWLFVLCAGILVVGSLGGSRSGAPPDAVTVWSGPLAWLQEGAGRGARDPRLYAGFLLVLVVLVYVWLH